jgi:hypothetical protein
MCARIGCSASARCVGPRSQPADKPDKLVYWGAVFAVHAPVRGVDTHGASINGAAGSADLADHHGRDQGAHRERLHECAPPLHRGDARGVRCARGDPPDRCRRRRRVAVGCCACLHARAGLKLTIVLPNIDSRKIDYRPRAGLGDHRPPHVRQDAQDHQGLREEQAGARPDSGGGAEVPGVLGGLPEGAPWEVRHAPRCED